MDVVPHDHGPISWARWGLGWVTFGMKYFPLQINIECKLKQALSEFSKQNDVVVGVYVIFPLHAADVLCDTETTEPLTTSRTLVPI